MLRALCADRHERCNHIRPLSVSLRSLAELYEKIGKTVAADGNRAEADRLRREAEDEGWKLAGAGAGSG